MKKLIFIVDDEPLLCEMANTVLREEGYQTQSFTNPEQVVDQIADHEADLLITDCVMGEMNGLELIEKCRVLNPSLKTLLLSGTVGEDFVTSHAIQPDRFMSKPYRTDKLIKAVQDLIGPS